METATSHKSNTNVQEQSRAVRIKIATLTDIMHIEYAMCVVNNNRDRFGTTDISSVTFASVAEVTEIDHCTCYASQTRITHPYSFLNVRSCLASLGYSLTVE